MNYDNWKTTPPKSLLDIGELEALIVEHGQRAIILGQPSNGMLTVSWGDKIQEIEPYFDENGEIDLYRTAAYIADFVVGD